MDIPHIFDKQLLGLSLKAPIVFLVKVVVIVLMTRLAIAIVNRFFRRVRGSGHPVLEETGSRYLHRIINFALYAICVSSILVLIPGMEKLGTSILTSAGILAAAVGLASQEALSNFVGGLFIIISKPFRVGDYIQVNGGVAGTVKEITLRHTVIVNTENRTIFVPNSTINSTTLTNSTVLDPRTCAFVEVGISYHDDIDHAMAVMRDEVMRHPLLIDHRTDAEREAGADQVKVKVIELGDSSIKLRAWAWAATNADAFNLKCDLLKAVKERFDREGIEIPYPYYNQVLVKN